MDAAVLILKSTTKSATDLCFVVKRFLESYVLSDSWVNVCLNSVRNLSKVQQKSVRYLNLASTHSRAIPIRCEIIEEILAAL